MINLVTPDVQILDGTGELIRTYTTDPKEAGNENLSKIEELKEGLNRLTWDFRHEAIPKVPDIMVFGTLNGRRAIPGSYRVRLEIGEKSWEQNLEIVPDPRRSASMGDYQSQETFLASATEMAEAIQQSVNRLREIREQVETLVERTEDHAGHEDIKKAGDRLAEKIGEWEENLIQPKQETFQDVINFENKLISQVTALIGSVDGTEPPVTRGAEQRLSDLKSQWSDHRIAMEALLAGEVAAFNTLIRESEIQPVILPKK